MEPLQVWCTPCSSTDPLSQAAGGLPALCAPRNGSRIAPAGPKREFRRGCHPNQTRDRLGATAPLPRRHPSGVVPSEAGDSNDKEFGRGVCRLNLLCARYSKNHLGLATGPRAIASTWGFRLRAAGGVAAPQSAAHSRVRGGLHLNGAQARFVSRTGLDRQAFK